MKVAMLTGGGDCPGLNAVLRAAVRKAEVLFATLVFPADLRPSFFAIRLPTPFEE